MNKTINFINYLIGTIFHLPSTIILLLVVFYRIIKYVVKDKEKNIEKTQDDVHKISDTVLQEAEGFRKHFDWFFWVIILIILI
jgi:hypothetical protein